MFQQTEQTPSQTTEAGVPATAPTGGAFAPQLSVHPVDELTLGRQTFNDSDKSNYFEG